MTREVWRTDDRRYYGISRPFSDGSGQFVLGHLTGKCHEVLQLAGFHPTFNGIYIFGNSCTLVQENRKPYNGRWFPAQVSVNTDRIGDAVAAILDLKGEGGSK